MGIMQRWRIVGAISGNSNHFTPFLQHFYQSLLVTGTGSRHYFQSLGIFISLFIGHGAPLWTRDGILLRCLILPNSNLTGDFYSSGFGITGYNFNLYSCILALLHCQRNILTYGVTNRCHRLKQKTM